MPEFAYVAKNTRGVSVQGTISAGGRHEALAALTRKSLFPLRVAEADEHRGLIRRHANWRPVRKELVADNLAQMADLLSNGVPLLESLEVLATQTSHPTFSSVLKEVRDEVADGASLDEAMSHHPRVFGELVVSMAHAGSAGAFLEEALQRTADFLTLQEELKRKVKGAMAYPVFLAIVGTIVTVSLIVFFVPKFAELFAKLESQGGLPWATTALLWLSDTFSRYGLLMIACLVGGAVGVNKLLASESGRRFLDRAKLNVPLFGPIWRGYAVARFCRVLGTLLGNGVPLLKSLDISSRATANIVFADSIRASAENISSGDTLAAPLADSGLFPPQIMAMIKVAEEANNLDNVLLHIAERIERRNGQQLEILVRLLEPAMLLVMGAIMLMVIVALLLPVFDLSSTVG